MTIRDTAGLIDTGLIDAAARAPIEQEPLARIDHVELRDADSLEPLARLDRPGVLVMAVFVGKTRLIDNRVLRPI